MQTGNSEPPPAGSTLDFIKLYLNGNLVMRPGIVKGIEATNRHLLVMSLRVARTTEPCLGADSPKRGISQTSLK